MSESEIFKVAVRMAPDQRAAYLDAVCGSDRQLRDDVEALLRAHEQPGGILQESSLRATEPGSTAAYESVHEQPGTRIGPYKLLEQIGEGGMGVVYMAEQQEPIVRRVAVKIIKPGMDSGRVIARFEAERQALAMMDHAHIAKVFDAGTTERGRPYFVMELVKGIPITRFCDQEHLTLRERLELFIPVCQAVQHAHQKGIIHRDLKPSNVLVGLYDGERVPKVIDFGVAKAISQKLTERTMFTQLGAIVGTLEYMSPEQAELNNLDIDTRADIYSLGVLLYELLTGATPFTSQQLRGVAYDEMLRIMREVEPPRPSTKLSSSEALPSVAAKRKLEPRRLTRLVAGDLDWIVMRCLEKERRRRYETANGLALDLARFLADEPVSAGPPSAAYRFRKFVRRHRGTVAAAAAIVSILVLGAVGTTGGLVWALHERDQKERARQEADARASEARAAAAGERKAKEQAIENERLARAQAALSIAVRDFLEKDLLALASIEGQEEFRALELGKNPTIRSLLDRASARIDGKFPNQPEIEAEIRWTIGVAYRQLGEYHKALPHLERGAELMRRSRGPHDPDTVVAMNSLAVTYSELGKKRQALQIYEHALASARRVHGPEHATTLRLQYNTATVYVDLQDLEKGLSLLEETLAAMQAKLGPTHKYTIDAMYSLGAAYTLVSRFDEQVRHYETTLETLQANLGPKHHDTVWAMKLLGSAYATVGKLQLALPLLEQSIELLKATYGEDHPRTLTTLFDLASVHLQMGNFAEALTRFQQTYEATSAKLGADHSSTLRTLHDLAAAYVANGQFDMAITHFEEVVASRTRHSGPNHPSTLLGRCELVRTYGQAGQHDKVLSLLQPTLNAFTTFMSPAHPNRILCAERLADAFRTVGDFERELPLREEVVAGSRSRYGRTHGYTQYAVRAAVECLEALQRHAEAEPMRRELVEVAQSTFGAESIPHAGELASLGSNLISQGRFADAEPIVRQSLEIRAVKSPDAWSTFNTKSLLGAALAGQKKLADAEPLLLEGYTGMKERAAAMPVQAKSRLSIALDRLIKLYDDWGKAEAAAKWRAEREAFQP